jgi:hypothetical protein
MGKARQLGAVRIARRSTRRRGQEAGRLEALVGLSDKLGGRAVTRTEFRGNKRRREMAGESTSMGTLGALSVKHWISGTSSLRRTSKGPRQKHSTCTS